MPRIDHGGTEVPLAAWTSSSNAELSYKTTQVNCWCSLCCWWNGLYKR